MKLTRREHENIAKRIITFHISSANSILKTTVSHFLKQKIPRQTIYDILKKYNVHKTTTFLSKSGRPPKFLTKKYNHLSRQLTTRLVSVSADLGNNLVYINQRSHVLSRRGLQLKYLFEEKLRSIEMKTKNTELNQILGHFIKF